MESIQIYEIKPNQNKLYFWKPLMGDQYNELLWLEFTSILITYPRIWF